MLDTNLTQRVMRAPINTGLYSRRKFLHDVSLVTLAVTPLRAFGACVNISNEDKQRKMEDQKAKGKLGIALVGLGGYSTGQLAPALLETRYCFLAGIVTGSPGKAENWKQQYGIPDTNIYNYQTFNSIKDNPDIDIIYVVLPNALHSEYVIRAARAGKHVICEKPMAVSVEQCDQMIEACKRAGKLLSIGYRLHFEPYNQEMMRIGREKPFGRILKMRAEDGFAGAGGWRLDKKLSGGGPLMDVGIYCVQGCRYTTGLEPVAVRARQGPKSDPEKFKSVEESLTWQMEFPGGVLAGCKTSYAESLNLLRAEAEKGWAELSPAYPYRGIQGRTSAGEMKFEQVNQQARQMDDFALAIKNNRLTPVPGEMGRQDVKILMAIYKAMESGQRVEM